MQVASAQLEHCPLLGDGLLERPQPVACLELFGGKEFVVDQFGASYAPQGAGLG
jgi:hypothetical protein